jgi:hypothetical protein
MMQTNGTRHMTSSEFQDALIAAFTGNTIVYCVGSLARAMFKKDHDVGHITALHATTRKAYATGNVHLVQKKLNDDTFEYRAVKRKL